MLTNGMSRSPFLVLATVVALTVWLFSCHPSRLRSSLRSGRTLNAFASRLRAPPVRDLLREPGQHLDHLVDVRVYGTQLPDYLYERDGVHLPAPEPDHHSGLSFGERFDRGRALDTALRSGLKTSHFPRPPENR